MAVLSNVVLQFPAGNRRVVHLGDVALAEARDTVASKGTAGTTIVEPSTDSSVMTYSWDGAEWKRGALKRNALPTACWPGDDQLVVIGPASPSPQRGTRRQPAPKARPWTYSVSVTGKSWELVAQRGKEVVTKTGALEGNVTPGLATVLASTAAALASITAKHVGSVTITASDRNAAAILRGERQGRKTAALASTCRAEIERLHAKVL